MATKAKIEIPADVLINSFYFILDFGKQNNGAGDNKKHYQHNQSNNHCKKRNNSFY